MPAIDLERWFNLNRREFERQFALPAVELKEVIALNAMDLLPEQSSIKIRSRDLHGPLPEIIVQIDPADRLGAFDLLGLESVKLCATTRLRRKLEEAFSGSTFLPPTRLDGRWSGKGSRSGRLRAISVCRGARPANVCAVIRRCGTGRVSGA